MANDCEVLVPAVPECPDERAASLLQEVEDRVAGEQIARGVMNALDELGRRKGTNHMLVLMMRYGIGGPKLTLHDAGLRLELNRERVRQIENQGLCYLRSSAVAQRLLLGLP